MKTKRLFTLGRYLRCRKIFAQPLKAHFALSYTDNCASSFSLAFKGGAVLEQEQPKRMRAFWDAVLYGKADALPLTYSGGVLRFNWSDRPIAIRPLTFDFVIFQEVFIRDEYRLENSGPLGTVIDLGGQIGMFSARARKAATKVYTVEAFPDNIDLLSENTGQNCDNSNVTVIHKAIGENSGDVIRLFSHAGNTGGHSVDEQHVRAQLKAMGCETEEPLVTEIEVISLSDLYKTYDIETCSLLKCDIEGAEHGVFDSIDDGTVLRADRYYMELHARAGEDSARIDKITNRLKRLDYDVEVGERMDLGEGTPWAVMVYATKNSL